MTTQGPNCPFHLKRPEGFASTPIEGHRGKPPRSITTTWDTDTGRRPRNKALCAAMKFARRVMNRPDGQYAEEDFSCARCARRGKQSSL